MLLPLWAPPTRLFPLGPAGLHLWLVELELSPHELEQARQVLTAGEVERARRFHFDHDRRRFVAAHAALRTVLAQYAGLAPRQLAFLATPHGKPYLSPDVKYAVPDLAFNLSHSGELALIAVTAGRRVGVDIELIRPALAEGNIAERFFSPGEACELAALPEHERASAFFRCWTRKEAFVKARGEGLSLPLASFDVSLRPDRPAALLRTSPDPDEAGRWTLDAVPIDTEAEYEAAVVVEGPLAETALWRFLRNT